MAATVNSHGNEALKNPGPFQTPAGTKTLLLVLTVIGVVTFLVAVMSDPVRAWTSFLHNHFYFMSIAIGGLFFAALQWLTGAMWSAPIRRVAESFTAYLPVVLVMTVVLYFGMHHLYKWTDAAYVKEELVVQGKVGYLNIGFFLVRNVIAVLIWIFFARKLVGNSIAQDATHDFRFTLKNRTWVPGFLIFFALSFTMVSFDLLMSLDPTWYSTMFGIYCFAGMFYSVLALTCLMVLFLKKQGHLEGLVNDNHLHDLGKFMFAFTVFWAYIGFCQFLLIWYANLPEETSYYHHRFADTWFYVSIFLLIGKFLVPFFVLMPRGAKRCSSTLAVVAIFMLVAQWIDDLWMIQPEFVKTGPHVGWVEMGVALGFIGLFGLTMMRFLAKNNVVAIGDPKLAESVLHHHQ